MRAPATYSPTPIKDIASSIGRASYALSGNKQRGLRSLSGNSIILAPDKSNLAKIDEILDRFTVIHPGRIFVVIVDDAAKGIGAEISARSAPISKSDNVFSEIIRITLPSNSIQALPSIIRSNLLTGMSTELFIFDPIKGTALIETLSHLTDEIIFDSSIFDADLTLVVDFIRSGEGLVDLQWIGCAPWRDQIRALFERFSTDDLLERLAAVEIKSISKIKDHPPSASLLLGGWIVETLGLEFVSYEKSRYECRLAGYSKRSHEPNGFNLSFTTKEGSSSSVEEMVLSFRDVTACGDPVRSGPRRVRLVRAEALETVVEMFGSSSPLRFCCPKGEEGLLPRLERFFMIGESVKNYRGALRSALELEKFKKDAC